MRDFVENIKQAFEDNINEFFDNPGDWICKAKNLLKVIGSIAAIVTAITVFANLIRETSEPLGYHVDRWLEQLPHEHELKTGSILMDDFFDIMRLQSSSAIFSSAAFDAGTELVKVDLSVRFGLLGDLMAWRIDSAFNQNEPIYSLFDSFTGFGVQYIELEKGQTVTISFYRNQEVIPLRYEDRLIDFGAMHVVRSFGFAMTYMQNPNIAIVDGDIIRAEAIGSTTLVIVYGANIFEIPVAVTESTPQAPN